MFARMHTMSRLEKKPLNVNFPVSFKRKIQMCFIRVELRKQNCFCLGKCVMPSRGEFSICSLISAPSTSVHLGQERNPTEPHRAPGKLDHTSLHFMAFTLVGRWPYLYRNVLVCFAISYGPYIVCGLKVWSLYLLLFSLL